MGEPDGTAEATKPATAGLTTKVANKVGKRVDGFFSGARSLLQHVEEKKDQITSKLLDSHAPIESDEKAREISDSTKKQQVVESVDGFLSRRIEGAKQLLNDVEEKKGKYFSKVSSGATDSLPEFHEESKPFGSSESAENQVVESVSGFLSGRIAGAKQLLHNVEGKKDEILSKVLESAPSLTQFSGGTDSVTKPTDGEMSKSLGSSESAQNQPLLEISAQPTPWWQSCCGLLDLIKNSDK